MWWSLSLTVKASTSIQVMKQKLLKASKPILKSRNFEHFQICLVRMSDESYVISYSNKNKGRISISPIREHLVLV